MNATPKGQGQASYTRIARTEIVDAFLREIQRLYVACDSTPWIVPFNGDNTSCAVIVLMWRALLSLPREQRKRHIYLYCHGEATQDDSPAARIPLVLADVAVEQGIPLQVISKGPSHAVAPELQEFVADFVATRGKATYFDCGNGSRGSYIAPPISCKSDRPILLELHPSDSQFILDCYTPPWIPPEPQDDF